VTKHYIVVAESTRAKIFSFEKRSQDLVEICDLEHSQGRRRESEINSDKPGRTVGGGIGSHHSLGSNHQDKTYEGHIFAGEISALLEADRTNHKYEGLILIAPPKFLGELRNELTAACNKLVIDSIDKNLVHCSNRELLSYLGSV